MLRVIRAAAPGVLLATLLLVPFFGKAFTIDDTLFLKQAQHLLTDPLHPTAFDTVWTEKPAPLRMSEIMASGPTMAYLLVPTVLAGGAEWVAHLTQLLLFVGGVVATTSLALRLGLDERGARTVALLLAATPAAIAMASSAMPDIAAMTFAAVGLERLLAWRDTQRWSAGLAAAVALAIAALARSHVLLLLPVGAFMLPGEPFSWRRWREMSALLWLPLVAVPFLYLLAAVIVRDPHGPSTVLAATLTYSDSSFLAANSVAFVTHWSFVIPLTLPWMLVRWRRVLRSPLLYLTAPAIWLVLNSQQPASRLVLVTIAGSLAAAVLGDIFIDAWKRRDSTQLALGLALLAPLPVGLYQHLPSKYLLIAAPAAAILVARLVCRAVPAVAWRVLVAAVPAGAILGLLIVNADAAFADLGRRAARELIATQTAQGYTVWFAGHWGFQWYAEQAGAKALTQHGPGPRPGDLIVSSQNALGGIVEMFQPRALIRSIADDRPGGRIMSKQAGAGFYSNAWGYLPWVWSDAVLDRYTLWRMDAFEASQR
jgi:hypothetical protein